MCDFPCCAFVECRTDLVMAKRVMTDEGSAFHVECLVLQTERNLSLTFPAALAPIFLVLFSPNTFVRLFMHTTISRLYVSVIMAEAIIVCQLKCLCWLSPCFVTPLLYL